VKKKAKKKVKKKAGGRKKKRGSVPDPRPPHDPDETDYPGPRVS
jgi:hypothetical protein